MPIEEMLDHSRTDSTSRFQGADPGEQRLVELIADRGRQHRKHRDHRQHHRHHRGSDESGQRREADERRRQRERRANEAERKPHPKQSLFCFPWIQSRRRRIRTLILRCFVSGLFVTLMLALCKCASSQCILAYF